MGRSGYGDELMHVLDELAAIEACLLTVLDGTEPEATGRQAAAARTERLRRVLQAAGDPVSAERARSVGAALRDDAPVGDRVGRLADDVAELRRALERVPDEVVETAPAGATDRRRRARARLLALGTPDDDTLATALAEAAAVRGVHVERRSPDDAVRSAGASGLSADVVVLLPGCARDPALAELVADLVGARTPVVAVSSLAAGGQVPPGAARVPDDVTGDELAAAALTALDDDPALGARIVVVSADAEVADRVEAALQDTGATAEHRAPGGTQADFRVSPPDLVVADGRQDLERTLSRVRGMRMTAATVAVPVVLLVPPGEGTEPVLGAGADDVLEGVPDAAVLRAVLRNRLHRDRALRWAGDLDPLTGLPRQVVALRRLGRLLERATTGHDPLSVALVGLDTLAATNETQGRAAGDALVLAAADLLRVALRDEDVVARWSGGEFLLVGHHLAVPSAKDRLEQTLAHARALEPAGAAAGTRLRLSAGVAGTPEAGRTPAALVDAASEALSAAQRAGGDSVVVAAATRADDTPDVLLVEDSAVAAAIVLRALDGLGVRVEHVTDGAEAARRLADPAQTIPRVVLLDWELPGIDGPGVLVRMREAGTLGRTRVVMLTGRSGEAEVLDVMRAGAHDHVPKPFSVPVLVERVRRALGS